MSSSSPSVMGARVRVSKCLIGGEVIVLRVMGLDTLSHRLLCGDPGCRRWYNVASGVMDASLAMRRRAFVLVRMECMSCRTDLGQRWSGRVCPLFGAVAFSESMDFARSMASSRMFWRSSARERIDSLLPSRRYGEDTGVVVVGGVPEVVEYGVGRGDS